MALSAATVWECRASANDLNGGGYVSTGTDYSLQDAAVLSLSDLACTGSASTALTSVTGGFTSAMVGNVVQIASGTNFTAGFYQITAFTSSTSVTLDRTPAASASAASAGAGKVGGALASPGKAQAARVAGNTVWWKGAFTITSASSNVSGGVVNLNVSGTQSAWNRTYGYGTTRGDNVQATLTLGAGLAATALTTNNANSYNEVRNVAVVGNATSGASALAHNGRSNRVTNFKASGFAGGGNHIVTIGLNASLETFELSGGATGTFAALSVSSAALIERGWVHGNAGRGVDIPATTAVTLHRIASTDHTGANGIGFQNQAAIEAMLSECVADNNAQSNYKLLGSNSSMLCRRCVSTRAGAYDFDNLSAADAISLDGCKTYSATSGQYPVTPATLLNHTVLSALPYAGSGDYGLNATAGAGAAARGVAYPLPGGTSTSYEDSGVSQHQDSGGGLLFGANWEGGYE